MNHLLAFFSVFFVMASCGEKNKREMLLEESEIFTEENSVSNKTSSSIPIFSFEELETIYLKSTSNKLVVLNFWATWCKPCVKELPAFEQLAENYEKDGVEVVLVSLDFPEHVEKAVIPFIEKNKIQNQVVLLNDSDANTWIPKVSKEWSGAIPATVIIKNGNRYFYEQSFTYESLEKEVQPLL